MYTRQKGLFIKQSFNSDFVNLVEDLYKKYGEEVFIIQGIANKHLDIVRFSKEFFGKSSSTSVADVSVDANANVNEKNVTQYTFENNKALMRLNSLNLLHVKSKEEYGVDVANEIIEKIISGEIFVNDLHAFYLPYCYAFDLRELLANGMNFYKGNMKVGPPKRSDSFIALVIQSTAYISNQIAGASSYPDFFVCLDKFYRAEFGENYMENGLLRDVEKKGNSVKTTILNQFQNLIYSFNFPFRGGQSLRHDEEIVVDGKTIAIGDFVNNYLSDGSMEKDISELNKTTHSLNVDTGASQNKQIKAVIKHKLVDDSLYTYELSTGQSFTGTKNHSLFTRDGLDIVECDVESSPTNVLVPFNFCEEEKVSTLDIEDVGGRLNIKKLMLTPEIMYMFGQYIGDGSISGSRLSISTFNADVDQYLENTIGQYFSTHRNSNQSFAINIGKNVAHAMIELFGKGSHNKRIPRDLYTEENIMYLIAGYMDADGHLKKDRNSYELSSVNKELLLDVQYILLSRGIISKISFRERVGFGKNSTIYRLVISKQFSNKISEYCYLKKTINNDEKFDYTRQLVDYTGIIDLLKKEYDISGIVGRGSHICNEVSYNNGFSIKEYNKFVELLESKTVELYNNTSISDSEYIKLTFGSSTNTDSKTDRKTKLDGCLVKLKRFINTVPIRISDIIKVDGEEFVYDISVKDNENFLTANNVFVHNSAFTNLSVMDMGFMKSLFDGYTFHDFTTPDLSSTLELSKMFFEYFESINCKEGMFTFPVMTHAISLDDNNEYIDPDFVEWSAKTNCEKSISNIFQSKPNAFSSCCRLKNEYDKVGGDGFQNSFGVGGLSIGSHRVCGLNLPRIALLEEENPNILQESLEIAHKVLYVHRNLIKERIEGGFLPLYNANWISIEKQYSTIGLIGVYEYLQNKGKSITNKKDLSYVTNVLSGVESSIGKWQIEEKDEKCIYNIEMIPGESVAVRLCDIDTILGYNPNKFELYSNQYISLTDNAPISNRLDIQGTLDDKTSGGAICHLSMFEEKALTKDQLQRIMNEARKRRVVYFAVNYAYSEDINGKYIIGKHDISPIDGAEIVKQYTRVVGFITPVVAWNKKRRDYEYPNRKSYTETDFEHVN